MIRPIVQATLIVAAIMGAASCGGEAKEPAAAASSKSPATPPPSASPSPSTTSGGGIPFGDCDQAGAATANCRKELDATHRALASLRKKVRSRPNHVALTNLIKQADTLIVDFRHSPCSLPNAPTDMSPDEPGCEVQKAFLLARWSALQGELNNR